MDKGDIIASIITGTIGLFMVVALIVLIIKRIKDKRNERFEKRDN